MVKFMFPVLLTGLFLSGCRALKQSAPAPKKEDKTASSKKQDPRFLEDVSLNPGSSKGNSSSRKKRGAQPSLTEQDEHMPSVNMDLYHPLQFKYAILLDVPVEEIDDFKLLDFMDAWYGTRYRYGGNTREGVDCSALVQNYMVESRNKQVPRTALMQYNQAKKIKLKDLRTGDLVFFKTRGNSISHVGIYLSNNKFFHASTSSGVMISDLDEPYFSRRFAGAGRIN